MSYVYPLNSWSFLNDQNLRSYLKMRGLHWDNEGNIWKDRCGINCRKIDCYILLQVIGKRTDNNYNLRVFKHTDSKLVGSVFLARFWAIPSLFEKNEIKNDLRVGQVWHIIDREVKIDDVFIIDYINTQALRMKALNKPGKDHVYYGKDHIYLRYDISEFLKGHQVWKRLLVDV